MSGFPVYVAAPYALAQTVLVVHEQLSMVGCAPMSHWARLAKGTIDELVAGGSEGELLSAIQLNDACIDRSHAMLVLSNEEAGGEMFCEVGRALSHKMPILWTGPRRVLSSFRHGVFRVELAEAMRALTYAAEGGSTDGSWRRARTRLFGWFGDWPMPRIATSR